MAKKKRKRITAKTPVAVRRYYERKLKAEGTNEELDDFVVTGKIPARFARFLPKSSKKGQLKGRPRDSKGRLLPTHGPQRRGARTRTIQGNAKIVGYDDLALARAYDRKTGYAKGITAKALTGLIFRTAFGPGAFLVP